MPDDWKKLAIPLGVLLPILMALGVGYGWAHANLVWAEDFKATVQSIQENSKQQEVRSLEREIKKSELEVIKLKAKEVHAPEKFDAVDKAVLNAHEAAIKDLKDDIKEVKIRGTPSK